MYIYIYIYIYTHTCIYIHIQLGAPASARGPGHEISLGAKDYTSEITNVKFHQKIPLKLNISSEDHWESDNPLEIPLTSENMVEHAIDNSMENTTGNPRLFLRC